MANEEQLSILKQGVEFWNKWRIDHLDTKIDLSDADLSKANLSRANLSKANLQGARLDEANLDNADFTEANLYMASVWSADLHYANFTQANLKHANLSNTNSRGGTFDKANLQSAMLNEANLSDARFIEADLRGANLALAKLDYASLISADLRHSLLSRANLVRTKVNGAKVSNSLVYGINIWDLDGDFEEQNELVLTTAENASSQITVDNIKVAQFIYLILNNSEIRHVINTLTSKSVLILGRFALPERKAILDGLRNELRKYDLLPIVFDFDRPADKDFTETIKTLAGLSYFVIADVTNPKSSPLELQATVPDYQIPFVPIIQEGEDPFAMLINLQKKYDWVLNTVRYDSEETLMKVLKPLIIDPAMKKRQELRTIKAQEPEIISAKDFLAKGGS